MGTRDAGAKRFPLGTPRPAIDSLRLRGWVSKTTIQFFAYGRDYQRRPELLVLSLIVFTLILLRLFGDALVGSNFLRAYAGRTIQLWLITAPVWLLVVRFFKSSVVFKRAGLSLGLLVWLGFVFLLNIFLTLSLSYLYDDEIQNRVLHTNQFAGFATLHYPNQPPVNVRRRADGSYEHRELFDEIEDREIALLRVGEDIRQGDRISVFDPLAIGRAITAFLRRQPLQGASGIDAQLAALLFDIDRGMDSTWLYQLQQKIRKTVIGIRVDDLYTRREQARIYLSLVSFGSIAGHETIGLQAAAIAYYGVDHHRLSVAQLAELIARVRNPNLYFPLRRRYESEERFRANRERLLSRARWILNSAERTGAVDSEARTNAEQELLQGLRSPQAALESMRRARLNAVFEELRQRVPDHAERRLEVYVGFDQYAQLDLEAASAEALRAIDRIAPRHSNDDIVIDAAVLDEAGAIAARCGMANIEGGAASHVKEMIYGKACGDGKIASMDALLSSGHSARYALAHSVNVDAVETARKVGLEALAEHFRTQGLSVTGPYPSIALGAGVSGSPTDFAAIFSEFAYAKPGYKVVSPGLIAQVNDSNTGERLFKVGSTRIFDERVAIDVRSALETCAISGTARRLASLSRRGTVAAKTGSAGFFRDGKWQGEGGSWTLAADSVTNTVIAVRVKWKSNRPFELDGGESAILVVKNFFERARSRARDGAGQ